MKKTILILSVLITAAHSPLYAQRFGSEFSLGAFIGLNIPDTPSAEFRKQFENSIGFGMDARLHIGKYQSLNFQLSMSHFPVNRSLVYEQFEVADNTTAELQNAETSHYSAILTYNQFLTSPNLATGFYLKGGLGYFYFSDVNYNLIYQENGQTFDRQLEISFQHSNLGMTGGAGIETMVGLRLILFFEVNYNVVFSIDENTGYFSGLMGLRIAA